MADTQCKTCRRSGEKLFLKEEKCFGQKCAMSRKPYAPGRQSKRRSPLSEYGKQLREKQSLKFLYGLRERQFANVVNEAMRKGGTNIVAFLLQLLELRLDNVVFRLGLAKSRSAARQMVSHGHICVNGRKVTIPSHRMKTGDSVSIRTQSIPKKVFADLDIWLKKYSAPLWLKIDRASKLGEVIKEPDVELTELGINVNAIIEFYSR